MRTITASEAKQSFANLIDTANREPVIIQRQKRDVAVVLSMAEYERLTGLNVAEFQRFCDRIGSEAEAAGLNEAKLAGFGLTRFAAAIPAAIPGPQRP